MAFEMTREILLHVLTIASYGLLLLLFLRLTLPAYLAFRKRKGGFGTVFNSQTDAPEALATVSLRDLHGQVVRTAVTDREGRYRLLAPKGEYYVEVVKEGFKFPSVFTKKDASHTLYEKLLPSPHILIKDYGAMTKNIPIDPVAAGRHSSLFRRKLVLGKHAQYGLAAASPFLAFVLAYAQPFSIPVWTLFGLYVAVLGTRLFSFKPPEPPFGTIRDTDSGLPMSHVIVRAFEAKYNKLLETQVTSEKGRYAFFVPPGSYKVLCKKQGYKTVILNFPNRRKDGALLAKDVRMKKL